MYALTAIQFVLLILHYKKVSNKTISFNPIKGIWLFISNALQIALGTDTVNSRNGNGFV